MRIEIYYHGKHLSSESPLYAMTNFMAFVRAAEKLEPLRVENVVMSLHETMANHFDEWFEEITKSHELHIVDMDGNRLYDQYLVSEDVKDEKD